MKERMDPEIERILKTVALAPAPIGLRERILRGIPAGRRTRSLTTPLVRFVLIGCSAFLVLVLVMDALIGKIQKDRIQALVGYTAQHSESLALPLPGEEFFDSWPERLWIDRMSLLAYGKAPRRTWHDIRNMKALREEYDGN
jgi:hypothetical protein